ncbi:F-box domain-containing protein, partial [Favolaschia claudopus]
MSNASTVAKLIEQIQALSATIEVQKGLLFDWEQRWSNARMTLNSYLDPMARLPVEKSKIFLDVEPGTADKVPHPLAAPMVFLSISRLWHAVAIATPRLWTALKIELLPRRVGYIKLCNLWIQRARRLPLLLALEG